MVENSEPATITLLDENNADVGDYVSTTIYPEHIVGHLADASHFSYPEKESKPKKLFDRIWKKAGVTPVRHVFTNGTTYREATNMTLPDLEELLKFLKIPTKDISTLLKFYSDPHTVVTGYVGSTPNIYGGVEFRSKLTPKTPLTQLAASKNLDISIYRGDKIWIKCNQNMVEL